MLTYFIIIFQMQLLYSNRQLLKTSQAHCCTYNSEKTLKKIVEFQIIFPGNVNTGGGGFNFFQIN